MKAALVLACVALAACDNEKRCQDIELTALDAPLLQQARRAFLDSVTMLPAYIAGDSVTRANMLAPTPATILPPRPSDFAWSAENCYDGHARP